MFWNTREGHGKGETSNLQYEEPLSMPRIIEKRMLAPNVGWFEIEALQIAKKRKAGQFIILRIDDAGERIPLTIADSDPPG